MTSLINRVRRIINDPAGAEQVSDDQQIQDALDSHREDVRDVPLTPRHTTAPGGTTQWLDFYAGDPSSPIGDWEDGSVFKDQSFNLIVPSVSEPVVGHWGFPASNSVGNMGQIPPVYLTGSTYDPNDAAAELLEWWAAHVKLQFDFGMGRGDSFTRSQKQKQLLELAAICRGKRRIRAVSVTRYDGASGYGGAW